MRVRVKICGIRNSDERDILNICLPDYAGFVFAQSSRRVEFETAKRLLEGLDHRIKKCGVFKGNSKNEIIAAANTLSLDVLQLHDMKNESELTEIEASTGAETWIAVNGVTVQKEMKIKSGRKMLFDSKVPGSGKRFDWDILNDFSDVLDKVIIAGGLDPDNISGLLSRYRPFCLDVSTGVESNGLKNEEAVRRFIDTARGE